MINYIIIKKNKKNRKTKKRKIKKINSLMILNKEERKQAQAVILVYPYQHQLRKKQVNLERV